MIIDNQMQLIKRLKQQPRHGQAGLIGDVERALKSLFEAYQKGAPEIVRLNVFGKLSEQANSIARDLSILQDINQGLSEDFNVSAKGAADLGIAIEKIAKAKNIDPRIAKEIAGSLRDVAAGQTKYLEKNTELGQKIIQQGEQYVNQLGVAKEAYQNITALQLQQFKNDNKQFGAASEAFADVAATLEKVYEYKGALTDIGDSFLKLDAKTRTVFGRVPENLGLALVKSKALGVEMTSITEGAKGFLNVEEAIANELEFQLLSGEELTTLNGENLTTEMQKAVLAQDANRQVELFAGFVQKYGDELRSNVFLQEQAAATFGVQQDDLFKAMEGIAAQSATATDSVKNLFQANVDAGIAQKENFNEQVKLESELSLAKQVEQEGSKKYYSEQQYTSDQVVKNQKQVLEGSKQLFEKGSKLTEAGLSAAGGLTGIASMGVRSMNVAAEVVNFATSPSNVLTRGQTGENLIPQTTDDLFMPASAGTVITGPLGSFALNSKDDVLAMPGIGRAVGGAGGGGGESIGSAVASALKGMSFHVTNVFDGQKIRSSLQILDQSTLNNI